MAPPVRVVVVEDSELQRAQIVAAVEGDGALTVVGVAGTVAEAARVVSAQRPDVVTMDLELPGGGGGVAAITRVLAEVTVPVLVLSAHARSRQDTVAIEALAAGAVDVLPKDVAFGADGGGALRRRLLVLSRLQMVTRRSPAAPASRGGPRPPGAGRVVLALAASTGGPSALRTVIGGLGADLPGPVLVVQHIHPDFGTSFARWLQDSTTLPVCVPAHGDHARSGQLYVAPAGRHLLLAPGGRLALSTEPPALSVPSCDELLSSVAAHAGAHGVGAVLTGMGDDGARGLLALRRAGGTTFAQDGASAVVDGMPRAARENGGAQSVLGLDALGPALGDAMRRLAR